MLSLPTTCSDIREGCCSSQYPSREDQCGGRKGAG
ncbi:hypothetical protein GCK32_014511 [Trichostrongylus colubriformis]|uniref:Uncharacterized protein n=1 Tax=Trichostrongylus colubriformis TaxID=6319 RepID=A0AAN8F6L9_TRICO